MTSTALRDASGRRSSPGLRDVNLWPVVRMRGTRRADTRRYDWARDVIKDRHYAGTLAEHAFEDATDSVAHLLLGEVAQADTARHQPIRHEEGSPAIAAISCCPVPPRVGSCRRIMT